jgi:hypothetical protein
MIACVACNSTGVCASVRAYPRMTRKRCLLDAFPGGLIKVPLPKVVLGRSATERSCIWEIPSSHFSRWSRSFRSIRFASACFAGKNICFFYVVTVFLFFLSVRSTHYHPAVYVSGTDLDRQNFISARFRRTAVSVPPKAMLLVRLGRGAGLCGGTGAKAHVTSTDHDDVQLHVELKHA